MRPCRFPGAGSYSYMQDLQALEATATGQGPRSFQPATPLRLQEWQQALQQHPDKCFANYILGDISKGFHIGVRRPCALTASRQGNLPSVREHNWLVAQHITAEWSAGRLLGPVPPQLAIHCHVSPIGIIPKPHQPGKWRLFVDLSSPRGGSVNDGISVEVSHMRHASVLDAAALIRYLGRGTVLAKIDLKNSRGPSPCGGPPPASHQMGWGDVYRHGPPLRPPLSPEDFLCPCRCTGLDTEGQGCGLATLLLR